jgi:hypothetical protein
MKNGTKDRRKDSPKSCVRLSRSTLETTSFTLRETAPDSKSLIMSQGVLKALLADFAGETDPLCFTSRPTFLRKECFGIGLSTKRSLLPRKFNDFATI